MIAKPLLKAAASWIAIAAFAAACATAPAGSSAGQGPATAEQAQAYVEAAERELAERSEYEARIARVYNTNINFDTEWLLQRSDADATEARVRLASGAGRFANLDLPPDTRRERAMHSAMRQEPYVLDELRRRVVLRTIQEVAAHRGWKLWAVHVRPAHVHVVITAACRPEKVMIDLKA